MEREERQVLVFVSEVSHLLGAIDLALGDHGYRVRFASDRREALDRLGSRWFDLLITDLESLRTEGADLVEQIHHLYPGTTIMILHGGEEPVVVPGTFRREDGYYLVEPGREQKDPLPPAVFAEINPAS